MPCLDEIFQLFPQSIEEYADLHGDMHKVACTVYYGWVYLKDLDDKDGFTGGETIADPTKKKDFNKLILQGRVTQPPCRHRRFARNL
jgi:hypothetical protein